MIKKLRSCVGNFRFPMRPWKFKSITPKIILSESIILIMHPYIFPIRLVVYNILYILFSRKLTTCLKLIIHLYFRNTSMTSIVLIFSLLALYHTDQLWVTHSWATDVSYKWYHKFSIVFSEFFSKNSYKTVDSRIIKYTESYI